MYHPLHTSFYQFIMEKKVIILLRFGFYLIFCDFVILLQRLVLYCLVKCFVYYRLIVAFYLCVSNSNRQNIFDKTKITNYIMVVNMLQN